MPEPACTFRMECGPSMRNVKVLRLIVFPLCFAVVAGGYVATGAPTLASDASIGWCLTWSKLKSISPTQASLMLQCPTPPVRDEWCSSVEQMDDPSAVYQRAYIRRCRP